MHKANRLVVCTSTQLFDFAGGCINASPAGKRRIAAAAEQQQFGSAYSGGLYGGFLDEDVTGNGGGYFSHMSSPLTAITAVAVAACLAIVTIVVVVFAVLQVSGDFIGNYLSIVQSVSVGLINVRFVLFNYSSLV